MQCTISLIRTKNEMRTLYICIYHMYNEIFPIRVLWAAGFGFVVVCIYIYEQ